MDDAQAFLAARTPQILWVELTSKCPFDCIFCSRHVRRGAGGHLPFAVYSSLLDALEDPRKFILNYSGESSVYPALIQAIQRARATGSIVEMVTVMASMPEALLGPLSQSGLNRLTVSVHATDPEKFAEIYRYSSVATLRSRLERFIGLCRTAAGAPPVVDLAFVAMDTNLSELASVAALAKELELRDITIFPVIRRDQIPARFTTELTALGAPRPEFEQRVQAAVRETVQNCPEIRISIFNQSLAPGDRSLGEVPVPYPWELPQGAFIHTCDQNPWETTHVLSNGDVVACEVLDKIPLGNLGEQSIGEIWHGPSYQGFRERYRRGEVPECRTCPWKTAYRPGPLASKIIAARGFSAQLLHGWHKPSGEDHIWSCQQAAAVLAPHPGSRTLHLSGMLPQGLENNPNQLIIGLNGTEIGRVTNPWKETCRSGWISQLRRTSKRLGSSIFGRPTCTGLRSAVPETTSAIWDLPWCWPYRKRSSTRHSPRNGRWRSSRFAAWCRRLTSGGHGQDATGAERPGRSPARHGHQGFRFSFRNGTTRKSSLPAWRVCGKRRASGASRWKSLWW